MKLSKGKDEDLWVFFSLWEQLALSESLLPATDVQLSNVVNTCLSSVMLYLHRNPFQGLKVMTVISIYVSLRLLLLSGKTSNFCCC